MKKKVAAIMLAIMLTISNLGPSLAMEASINESPTKLASSETILKNQLKKETDKENSNESIEQNNNKKEPGAGDDRNKLENSPQYLEKPLENPNVKETSLSSVVENINTKRSLILDDVSQEPKPIEVNNDEYEYKGYQNGSTGPTMKLYVEKKMILVLDELSIVSIKAFTGLTQKVLQRN